MSFPLLKQIAFGLISAFGAILLLLVGGEMLLRVIPLGAYRSSPFRQYDAELGLSLIPNRHTIHRRGCFVGEIEINRWGWRDRDRTLEKPPDEFRIALLGDSAVEDAQVKPQEVLNIQMEQQLLQEGYKNIEVMSFGVEGIGTTQELIMYERRVRQFHPDLVVLMFSPNDVMNNSSTIQPKSYGIHSWYAPYYDLSPSGDLVFSPVASRPLNRLRTFLERRSVLAYYLERTWLRVDWSGFESRWEGLPIFFGTFSDDPLEPEWQQAWTITEKVLRRMQSTITADGAKFIVMAWPGLPDIDRDWRQHITNEYGKIPENFNPSKPAERLRQLALNADIPIEFLAPHLISYRDAHNLQWPYFSFTCDPHYTAMGNAASANAVIQELQHHHLLTSPLHPQKFRRKNCQH